MTITADMETRFYALLADEATAIADQVLSKDLDEDARQDGYEAALQAAHDHRPEDGPFGAYVAAATRSAATASKAASDVQEEQEVSLDTEQYPNTQDDNSDIADAVDKWPEKDARVMRAFFGIAPDEQETMSAIAAKLGLSGYKFNQHIKRLLVKLARELQL